jgi:hypothetical protein
LPKEPVKGRSLFDPNKTKSHSRRTSAHAICCTACIKDRIASQVAAGHLYVPWMKNRGKTLPNSCSIDSSQTHKHNKRKSIINLRGTTFSCNLEKTLPNQCSMIPPIPKRRFRHTNKTKGFTQNHALQKILRIASHVKKIQSINLCADATFAELLGYSNLVVDRMLR